MHLLLHVLVPALLAITVYRKHPWSAFAWLMAGMLIDLDHLLANPVYDPLRCSLGFHPLHTWPAAVLYLGLFYWRSTRILALGLCVHLLLDASDCLGMPGGLDSLMASLGKPWTR